MITVNYINDKSKCWHKYVFLTWMICTLSKFTRSHFPWYKWYWKAMFIKKHCGSAHSPVAHWVVVARRQIELLQREQVLSAVVAAAKLCFEAHLWAATDLRLLRATRMLLKTRRGCCGSVGGCWGGMLLRVNQRPNQGRSNIASNC